MKTIDKDPRLNTITTTSMNTNTSVVSLRGYCTLPPATPASVMVEGIFKWNPGKCAKSHHAILYTVTIPSRL